MNAERIHRVLVIGVGSIGERHARCFQKTGRATVGVVDVNAALRDDVARRYGVPGFADLGGALAAGFDAAVIATPAHLHLEIARRLAGAGLDLLIEKPLGTALDGVGELRRLLADQRRVVAVAYNYRAIEPLAAMREAVRSGRFGRPVEVVTTCGQPFGVFRPAYREIYYRSRATGGGAVQDALTHIVNAVEWVVGPAERVVADAAHLVLDGVEVEDTVHVLARHGAVLASYSLNQHQASNENTITIVCERGTARFEGHEQRWRWCTEPGGPFHDEAFPQEERDAVYVRQANRFLDARQGTADVACSLEEGAHTLAVNLAILESLDRGAWVEIPQG